MFHISKYHVTSSLYWMCAWLSFKQTRYVTICSCCACVRTPLLSSNEPINNVMEYNRITTQVCCLSCIIRIKTLCRTHVPTVLVSHVRRSNIALEETSVWCQTKSSSFNCNNVNEDLIFVPCNWDQYEIELYIILPGCHISSPEGRELLWVRRWPTRWFGTCYTKKSCLYFRNWNQLLCPFSKVLPATMLCLLWITRQYTW